MLLARIARLVLLEGCSRVDGAFSRVVDPFGFTRIDFEFDSQDA